jgi:hypothetical protein
MNKRTSFWRLGIGLLVLPLGLMAAGCGSSQGTVSGKVTFQGKVVPGGTVSIIPAKGGGLVSGNIQEDGSYTISKVPVGPAKVTVDTEALKPASASAPMQAMGNAGYYAKMPTPSPDSPGGGKIGVGPKLSQGDPKRYMAIPRQYSDPEQSGLSLTVKGGKNEFNIDLK